MLSYITLSLCFFFFSHLLLSQHVPSPVAAAKHKVERLYTGPMDSAEVFVAFNSYTIHSTSHSVPFLTHITHIKPFLTHYTY